MLAHILPIEPPEEFSANMPNPTVSLAKSSSSPRLAAEVLGALRYPLASSALFTSSALLAALALTGCGATRMIPTAAAGSAATLHGIVHGGQQPVAGAAIQLYAAGSTGNGSAATPLLTSAVATDSTGGFNISGTYTCPTATTQVYLTAAGGNPGLAGNTTNPALAMVVALGDCGDLPSTPSVAINEITTAAAAWSLAPFAAAADHIGASSTNLIGLRNAMATARMLADSTTGQPTSPLLPANATVESAKLISMADLLASCVNSDGTTLCSGLFADAAISTTLPTDTFQAALSIVQNPGHNVTALFYDMPAQVAFGGELSTAPNDWTMSISSTGGGLSGPNAVTIDANGIAYVSNWNGAVAGFNPQGAWLWEHGVSGAGLAGTTGIAVDPNGNIWAANTANGTSPNTAGSITAMTQSGYILSPGYGYTTGVQNPSAIGATADGKVWVIDRGHSIVSLLDASGNPLSGTGYGGLLITEPSALAVNNYGNVWITDKTTGYLSLMDQNGAYLHHILCCTTPDSVAIDSRDNVWTGDSTLSTITQMNSSGIPVTRLGGAFSTPKAIAPDGAHHLFVVNMGSDSIAQLTDSSAPVIGALLSPSLGYGLDANLNAPRGAAVDASGNVWVTSSADNRLVRFVGLAGPRQTPSYGIPVQP